MYLKFKSSPTDSNKLLLASYRNKLTNLIHLSKKNYYCSLLDDHKHNLKQTWKILNGLLGRDRKKHFQIVLILMVLFLLISKLLLMVLIIISLILGPHYPVISRIWIFRLASFWIIFLLHWIHFFWLQQTMMK